jgi:hypothetical protein
MNYRAIVSSLSIVLFVGCVRGETHDMVELPSHKPVATAPLPTTWLVDFAEYEIESDSVAKVEVTSGNKVDTVSGRW